MERYGSTIISWYQCAKAPSLCKSHSLVNTSIYRYTLIGASPSSTTCWVFITYHYMHEQRFLFHTTACIGLWSRMAPLLANPLMHWHQKETGGLCKLVRKQIERYANATPASKTAMQNVFPAEMHGTHARACPARRAKPLPRRKRCICAYSSIRLASPREILSTHWNNSMCL